MVCFNDAQINTEIGHKDGYAADVAQWIPNLSYYPRNLIAFVIRNGILETEEGSTVIAQTVRALIELHPHSITGLNTGFDINQSSTKKVTFKFSERYGRPIDTFFTWWYAKYQSLWSRGQAGDEGTIDVMFVEPDPTHTKVAHAIFMYHMRPTQYSGIESKRDLWTPRPAFPQSEKPKPTLWQRIVAHLKGDPIKEAIKNLHEAPKPKPTTLEVTFTGETSIGPQVNDFAQKLLDAVQIAEVNPYVAPDPKVFGALRRKGPDVYQF